MPVPINSSKAIGRVGMARSIRSNCSPPLWVSAKGRIRAISVKDRILAAFQLPPDSLTYCFRLYFFDDFSPAFGGNRLYLTEIHLI